MITGIHTHISIGSRRVTRCPALLIESQRHATLTRAEIVLPDADRDLFRTIAEGEPVLIHLGYRNQTPAVWTGSVTHLTKGATRDQVRVSAAGPELPLVRTKIIQSWENETPEAIIAWAIAQAGVTAGRIDATGVVIPRFSVGNIPVWELVRSVENTLQRGHDMDMSRWALWMDEAGRVNWGDFDGEGEIPVIETGANLICHTPATGLRAESTLETFLLPGLRHSMRFRLIDRFRAVNGRYRALKVRHETGGNRARTFISWGIEHEKY